MPTNLYKDAGVDTEQGDRLVDWLQKKSSVKNPYGKVASGIGGFAALFRPNFKGMKKPLLIASTDGVGTKLLLGLQHNHLQGLGQDLVAMCVNDLYTVGGRPLFFLDYYATGKLDDHQFQEVLTGIKSGCAQSSMHLIGGETAELPGLYAHGHFDLAGFVIGVVDERKMLGPKNVKVGDTVFAIASNGFHSNGYSLIRKWCDQSSVDQDLVEKLLRPTVIYHQIPKLVDKLGIKKFHALANITGGGISGNLPRVLPKGVNAVIYRSQMQTPGWMQSFMERNGGNFDAVEPVFNLGCGMVAVCDRNLAFDREAKKLGLNAYQIGTIEKSKSKKSEATVIYES